MRRAAGWGAAVLAACLLGAAGNAAAAEAPWTPPAPDGKGFDWVRLVSGEWLGGTIESLREGTLEFDSDKLDLLQLDWEDVAEVRSPRRLEYVFDDGRKAMGPAVLAAGVVRVRVGTAEQVFPASELVSIVEGAVSEWDRWSLKATLGIVVRSGNTEQSDLSTYVFLRRETGRTRFDLSGSGNHGKVAGVKSVNSRQGSTKLDIFLTQRLYVTPFYVEVYTDEFQNVDVRTTASAGLGYDLVDTRTVEWSAGLSAGYLRTDYLSVEPGEEDVTKGGTVIPTSALEWDPHGDVEIDVEYTVTVSTTSIKDAYHHLVGILEVDLTSVLDLDISTTWDHVETPTRAQDGTLPERDDVRVAFGLGVDF